MIGNQSIAALLEDENPAFISAKFHNTLAAIIATVAEQVGEPIVVLSGGCFQNRALLERSIRRLRAAGFTPYWQQQIPPNDGGIALGQIAAATREKIMCLAVPGKLISISGEDLNRTGRVSFGGVVKEVSLAYVPEVQVGDYVIVHVGFALSKVDEAEAQRVFEYLEAIGDLGELYDN